MGERALAAPLARLEKYGHGSRSVEEVFAALQEAAGRHLMVVRNARGLETLLEQIATLREEWLPEVALEGEHDLRRAVEAENSLRTAELMARAALMRRESRGSHFREDYPETDDANWRVNIILRLKKGQLYQEKGVLGQWQGLV
jgi:succinate dehydrogenase/fumarate reductase flavoprotein subunit